jgi:hypothetical protein
MTLRCQRYGRSQYLLASPKVAYACYRSVGTGFAVRLTEHSLTEQGFMLRVLRRGRSNANATGQS